VPFILGVDFLAKTKANIQFGNLSMTIGERARKHVPSCNNNIKDVLVISEEHELDTPMLGDDIPESYPNVELKLDQSTGTARETVAIGAQSELQKGEVRGLLQEFSMILRNQLPPIMNVVYQHTDYIW